MKALEAAAIAAGASEEELIDQAGRSLAHAVAALFPHAGKAVAYLGKGHNAADAAVALRILRDEYGWQAGVRTGFAEERWSPLLEKKFRQLAEGPLSLEATALFNPAKALPVLLDGLLGIGAQGELRSPLRELAEEMNRHRHCGAKVMAVDVPSGLDADSGLPGENGVIADLTITLGSVKRGLLKATAVERVGALMWMPLESLEEATISDLELISPGNLPVDCGPRAFDFHKGMAGRVGIVAGSPEFSGAAALAALGALRGGAGLVTVYTPYDAVDKVLVRCLPEVMVRGVHEATDVLQSRHDALVVGCGLASESEAFRKSVVELIERSQLPMVVDAEALHWIARSGSLNRLQTRHVLTPHPGEFRVLASDLADRSREEAVDEFRKRCKATLLLKGARTLIASQEGPVWCNATGTPGMAGGGQGDLLAGVIGARLAMMPGAPLLAAAHAAWLCGRAAERALLRSGQSEEALLASDVAGQLGGAFEDWRARRR